MSGNGGAPSPHCCFLMTIFLNLSLLTSVASLSTRTKLSSILSSSLSLVVRMTFLARSVMSDMMAEAPFCAKGASIRARKTSLAMEEEEEEEAEEEKEEDEGDLLSLLFLLFILLPVPPEVQ